MVVQLMGFVLIFRVATNFSGSPCAYGPPYSLAKSDSAADSATQNEPWTYY